ncbi:MAG TPA: DoxX family membrane protein [Chloroflexia bacterium]|nr:DoxX family membrane protein [Chloroflexia bacterium]
MHPIKAVLKWPLALLFIVSGVGHIVKSDGYLRLMPPALPFHLELVYLSGALEAALGVLLVVPRTQRFAAWAYIPTLLAIFPANIYAATTAGTASEAMPGVPVWAAWLRLPIQLVLIAWAYWYTRPDEASVI